MIQQNSGIIINIGSEASRWDGIGVTLGYAMSKAGLGRQTSILAKELREYNITVVNIEPGGTDVGRPISSADAGWRVSTDAPAATVTHIVTHPYPMTFSGKTIDAPIFAAEHALVDSYALGSTGPYGPAAWGLPPRAPRPLNTNPGS